jgi:hypothetical protein
MTAIGGSRLWLLFLALPLVLLTVRTERLACSFDYCTYEWSHGLVVPLWMFDVKDRPPEVVRYGGYRERYFQAGIYARWGISPIISGSVGLGGPVIAIGAYVVAMRRKSRNAHQIKKAR